MHIFFSRRKKEKINIKTDICFIINSEYEALKESINNCDKEIYQSCGLIINKYYILNESLNIYLDYTILNCNTYTYTDTDSDSSNDSLNNINYNNIINLLKNDLNNKIEQKNNIEKNNKEIYKKNEKLNFKIVISKFINKNLLFLNHLVLYKFNMRDYYFTIKCFNSLFYTIMKEKNKLYITDIVFNDKDGELNYYFIN